MPFILRDVDKLYNKSSVVCSNAQATLQKYVKIEFKNSRLNFTKYCYLYINYNCGVINNCVIIKLIN